MSYIELGVDEHSEMKSVKIDPNQRMSLMNDLSAWWEL